MRQQAHWKPWKLEVPWIDHMDENQLQTIPPPDSGEPLAGGEIPVLTIACHPDLSRIGERAALFLLASGKTEPVSRNEPLFQPPDGGDRRAISSPNVSRKPFRLVPSREGGITLFPGDSKSLLELEDDAVDLPRDIENENLSAGAILELNRRVVLLLHMLSPHAQPRLPIHGFVGHSFTMVRVREEIERIADLEMPVLIRGESGTGKELAARAIHSASPRRGKELVCVNLGAIPPNLAAAELFGAQRGAFTGATKDRPGFFRAADGGTLFLDEIGEAPPEVQVMLLRVLETGEIYPVGSQKPYKVDVRVIAATDSDLETRCIDGAFKTPLLHRLSSYELWLPPLRERREDIPRLFLHFADEALRELGDSLRNYLGHREKPWISTKLMTRLLRYSWPGNVRQLRNVVKQLIVSNRGHDRLELSARLEQLFHWSPMHDTQEPENLSDDTAPTNPSTPSPTTGAPVKKRKPGDVTEAELREAMARNKWEPAAAARTLNITRASVYVIMKKFHLPMVEDLTDAGIQETLKNHAGDVDAAAMELCVSARGLRRRLKKIMPEN
ncbi:MAG: sigma-54 dependent transcriptional regulator [Acidobacteriota bacterium]|nr:sigma-54 dependent transcriptional regulator [Acidobacteriota bacterium]